jgi:RimJ/RimL family protein N-acetyltransferase
MPYRVEEVNGETFSATIAEFNQLISVWPPLKPNHYSDGYWWITFLQDEPVAFAGLVPFEPFPNIGYCKRCLVKPDHHGHGLQFRMLAARELKAKQLGWTHLVSECLIDNLWSAANFRKAGYRQCEPEQPWAKNSIYWVKELV